MREIPGIIALPVQRTTSGLTWSRRARTAEMLLTEPRMRVSRPGGEPSGLLIGAGVKILGFSLERRRPTPAALPLIADGNSVVWTARLLCFALFPLEGRKTSVISIQTCHVQREGKNPLNSWPLAPATANGKGRSFTKTTLGAKRLGIHDDRGWRPPSQSDLPTREVD